MERERLRIARGLHDLLGPLFDEISAALEEPRDSDRLARGLSALQQAREATRSTSFDLGLPPIDGHGLGGLLQTVCGSADAKHPLQVFFEEHGDAQKIDDGVVLVLAQIVRELLINVVKHSEATTASVTLHHAKDALRVTVQDDGQGIDVNRVDPDGFGLADARRRIADLGGKFELGSKDGAGTRVVIEYPLPD